MKKAVWLVFIIFAVASAGGRVDGFPVEFGVDDSLPVWGAPAFVKLDSTAIVVFGSTDDSLYGFNLDGSPAPGFPVSCGGPVRSKVAWFARNDTARIVVLTSDGICVLFVWDGVSVFPAWSRDLGDSADYISPVLCDVDGDGEYEVIAVVDTVVYCLSGEGEIIWTAGFESSVGKAVATPACGDVDGDGSPEIFVESYSSLYAFDAYGTALEGFPVELDSGEAFSYSSPLLFDHDGDGEVEIFCGAHSTAGANYGEIVAFAPDGSPVGDPFFTVADYGAWVYSPLGWCDANGDYIPDIVFGDVSGGLYAVNSDGNISSFGGTGRGHPGHIYGTVAMCDLDHNAGPEYIFQLMMESDSLMLLVVMDPAGRDLDSFPDSVAISAGGIVSPAVEVLGDSTYIAAITPDGKLFLWGFEGAPLPGYDNWCQTFGDNLNDGVSPPRNVAITEVVPLDSGEYRITWTKSQCEYFGKYLVYYSPDSAGEEVSLVAETNAPEDTFCTVKIDSAQADSVWFFVVVEDNRGRKSLRSVPNSPEVSAVAEGADSKCGEFAVYPNPFNAVCNARFPENYYVEIYDVRGNLVGRLDSPGQFPADGLPSGIFIFALTRSDGKIVAVRKAVLVR